MKKILLCSAILAAASFNANAAEVKNPFYLGAGFQSSKVHYTKSNVDLLTGNFTYDNGDYLADDFQNFNLFAGYQVTKNIGVELGYFSKGGEKQNNNNTGLVWTDLHALTTKSETNLSVVNLDTVFNIAIDSEERFKLLGIVGAAAVRVKSDVDYYDDGTVGATENISDTGFGGTIGVGLEAEVVKDVASIRTTVKYTRVGSIEVANAITSYNVGLKFNF